MNNIANSAGSWQELPPRPIEIYPQGMRIHRAGLHFVPSAQGRDTRGKIVEFSPAARRRLRDSLLKLSRPGALRFGLTLTLPWRVDDFQPLMDEWRECLHRFWIAFGRAYPNAACIYRIELQTRGAPHLHALGYVDSNEIDRTGALAESSAPVRFYLDLLHVKIAHIWTKSVPDLHGGLYGSFLRRGAKVENLASDGAMLRYICDHTSKRKQAQLGYKGKQWGIIGKDNLTESESVLLPDFADSRHEVQFRRLLRKLMRYRVYAKRHPEWSHTPPFGSVLRGSRRTVGDFFVSRDTLYRLWDCSLIQSML